MAPPLAGGMTHAGSTFIVAEGQIPTILCVIGTRPEAIKMAPVVHELARHRGAVRPLVCVTGQHRQLLDRVLGDFGIAADIDLDLMRPDQSLADLTSGLFRGLGGVVRDLRPDWVLAQGDTTTVLAASLVAFYERVKFGHVEAGLRTGDRDHPFPEEVNRYVADKVADYLFAPTEHSRRTLLAEGHPEGRIVVTGNTAIDALHWVAGRPFDLSRSPLAALPADRRWVLLTAHRRESFGAPLRRICEAIRTLAARFAGRGFHFIYPVHPNPNVRETAGRVLDGVAGVSLIEPLDHASFVQLMKRSALILTDSGGVQEEAPGLGVPVLVLRETTERPEGVETGVVRLVGTDPERIVAEAGRLLGDPAALGAMSRKENPYGDGRAASRIVSRLLGGGNLVKTL
jgi:UDP-N-acetylglucosamine 2-epimerase (non-hydrolysing)